MGLNGDTAVSQDESLCPMDLSAGSPAMMQGERKVLERIRERCSAPIVEACRHSLVPTEFLGALTANESAGVATAARFEPAVYSHIRAVANGQAMAYGSIRARDVDLEADEILDLNSSPQAKPEAPGKTHESHARYLTPGFLNNNRLAIAALEDDVIRQLATSWGYTQIMGYHMVGRPGTVKDLLDPVAHYRLAVELLEQFAADFHLDVQCEFPELFCCWNTGRPYGKTYDPSYVTNGMRRLEVYRALAQQPRGLEMV
jgi:hypothetical protein